MGAKMFPHRDSNPGLLGESQLSQPPRLYGKPDLSTHYWQTKHHIYTHIHTHHTIDHTTLLLHATYNKTHVSPASASYQSGHSRIAYLTIPTDASRDA